MRRYRGQHLQNGSSLAYARPLEELYTDLRDGCVLLKLLEFLSGENPVSCTLGLLPELQSFGIIEGLLTFGE